MDENSIELIGVLGEGATAVTYEARDTAGNIFCIKRYKNSFQLKEHTQFLREIEMLKSLRHPQIPNFYGSYVQRIDQRDILHLIMEKIEGRNLQEWSQKIRLNRMEVIDILLSLLDILIYLHEVVPPVIHRDIKTSNVIRTIDGAMVLIDFGQSIDAVDKTYGHTLVTGTLGYQAPEQITGEPNTKSDVYSLGVVGVELLTGVPPYKMLEGRKLRWERKCTHLPDPLFSWLQSVLNSDSELRYSAREAKGTLQEIKSQLASTSFDLNDKTSRSLQENFQNQMLAALEEEDEKRQQVEDVHYQNIVSEERKQEQKRLWDTHDEKLFQEMVVAWDKTISLILERQVSLEKGLGVFLESFQGREAQRKWGEKHPKITMLFKAAREKQSNQEYHEWLIFRFWGDETSLFTLQARREELRKNIQKIKKDLETMSWLSGLFQSKSLLEKLNTEEERALQIEERIEFLEQKIQQYTKIFHLFRSEEPKNIARRIEPVLEDLLLIPRGEFLMGAASDDELARPDEKPQHKVVLTRDFYLGKYPVTQRLWEKVMGYNPSWFSGEDSPVEQISWYDAVKFCNKLSEMEGLEKAYTIRDRVVLCNWKSTGFRLPTEAEWAYAVRCINADAPDLEYQYSGSNDASSVAWWKGNSQGSTRPVGMKNSNGLGLYDMSGNIWEWCWDGKEDYSKSERIDPVSEGNKMLRVLRGGCWDSDSRDLRISARREKGFLEADLRTGFRVGRFVY